ncbi:MAG: hypothetical protein JW885_02820 [Deltaproteobacteria bacterium]|nr:hypothetical protein [Candidatus Zymogenaceae bacterium]
MMFTIEVGGAEHLDRIAAKIEALPHMTYQKVCERSDEIFGDIREKMPVLTGNLQKSVTIEKNPVTRTVTIRLPRVGVYNNHRDYRTTKYFTRWGNTHRSVREHNPPEKSRTKKMGLAVKANPNAVSEANKDVFRNALRDQGFRNIKRTKNGYRATPPDSWPFLRGAGRLR